MGDPLERASNYIITSDNMLNHTRKTPLYSDRFRSALNQEVATSHVVVRKNVEFNLESVGYFTIAVFAFYVGQYSY